MRPEYMPPPDPVLVAKNALVSIGCFFQKYIAEEIWIEDRTFFPIWSAKYLNRYLTEYNNLTLIQPYIPFLPLQFVFNTFRVVNTSPEAVVHVVVQGSQIVLGLVSRNIHGLAQLLRVHQLVFDPLFHIVAVLKPLLVRTNT